jgi:hypothetical protein
MTVISLGKEMIEVIINGEFAYFLEKTSEERTILLENVSVAKYEKCWFVTMKDGKIYKLDLYHSSWFVAQFPTFPYSANYSDDSLEKEIIKLNKELRKLRKQFSKNMKQLSDKINVPAAVNYRIVPYTNVDRFDYEPNDKK